MTPSKQPNGGAPEGAAAETPVEPDPVIALAVQFHTAHGEALAGHDAWVSEKNRVEALPDCPRFTFPAEDRAGYERHNDFMREHGVRALGDRSNENWRKAGALANAVFASPARTVTGTVEKLKILRLALGDHGEDRDSNLNAYNEGESWFVSVIRDLERLAAGD